MILKTYPGKNSLVVPSTSRQNEHITLFLAVSAVMRPFVLLSPMARNFDPLSHEVVVHYHCPSGYMTKDIFYSIMEDVFVKYVESVRSYYNLVGRRAVLVVDGHISRYTVGTVNLLIEHNIDLIILPSHSSHVTQPLDLGLNRAIKHVLRQRMWKVKPVFPKGAKRVGKPHKKGNIPLQSLTEAKFERAMKNLIAALLRGDMLVILYISVLRLYVP